MANIIQRIVNGALSVITTFVLMAGPIAAIIYFSEPVEQSPFGAMSTGYTLSRQTVADKKEQTRVIRQSVATEPIIALVKKLAD